MSLIAPLYFLGALAIGLPILFHLIRRQPKGHVQFSSLMFLRPTPPRLTRRSRLDNWLLLLVRALALMLLAAAFARPFLRQTVLSDAEVPGRRLVMLIDTSASMQRDGLWQQALDQADAVLSDLQPADRLAIVTFDAQPKTLLGFDQSTQLTPDQRKTTVASLLKDIAPTWHRTNLGRAVSFAGDLVMAFEADTLEEGGLSVSSTVGQEGSDGVANSSAGPAHMILISDMQSGSEIDSLQAYAWPKELQLDVRQVVAAKRTNAAAQVLELAAGTRDEDDRVRVRVANSPDASESRFRLRWSVAENRSVGLAEDRENDAAVTEFPVQVPPGQSRVIRMPAPTPGMTSLVLSGDSHMFDNIRYIVSPQPQPYTLLHVGPSPEPSRDIADPRDSLLYYLQRVPLDNPRRVVSVESLQPQELITVPSPAEVPLVVLSSQVEEPVANRLRDYVSSGGRLLVVLANRDQAAGLTESVRQISGTPLKVEEAKVKDYVMWSHIDFSHSLFRPMSDPQFNDFSKIRFWAHRKVEDVDQSWNVLARFDDGDPALLSQPIGEGELFLLTSGWQPRESQLALSTKFIPLVFSLFQVGGGMTGSQQYNVGGPIDLPPSATATMTTPDGNTFDYRTAEDAVQIDSPGIYEFHDEDVSRTFAVNLAESESHTDPLDEETLERLGVLLGKNLTSEQRLENQRQLRDQELEGQQKLWQWLLVAALCLLGLETVLGAIWSRRGQKTTSLASEGMSR